MHPQGCSCGTLLGFIAAQDCWLLTYTQVTLYKTVQVIFRNMYVYTYMRQPSMKREAMGLKDSKERCVGGD